MQKNVANQLWTVYAYNSVTGAAVTGDAANITANLYLDGAVNAVDDTNPTELEDGLYNFGITQAESNADHIAIAPESSTPNVLVVGYPTNVWTRPPNFQSFLAYFQLMSRKDAAIATDKATELAEINANTGTGAGAFDNETDSEEALADAAAGGGTPATIAAAVWDRLLSLHTIAGSAGKKLFDVITRHYPNE